MGHAGLPWRSVLCWMAAQLMLVLLIVGAGRATTAPPPPAPLPATPSAERVGAIASLPTDAADGHTPTFAFTVAPEVDARRTYSYDEFVAFFGTTLQSLGLDIVDTFTKQLDRDPQDSRLAGAEVAALAKLLDDAKREALRAVRACTRQIQLRSYAAAPSFHAVCICCTWISNCCAVVWLQKEEAPLRPEEFEERYARWLKPGSLHVFEQLDVNSDQLVDSTEIRKRMPRWLTATRILQAGILACHSL